MTDDEVRARLQHLEAGATLYEAHTENLIERVYELEQIIEAMEVRLRAVERSTPLAAPKKAPKPRWPGR